MRIRYTKDQVTPDGDIIKAGTVATVDDEAGYRLGDRAFAPGEYVSIRDDDGELHTFTVVTVTEP